MTFKNACIKALDVTDDDMKKINKLAVRSLKKEDVYVFKLVLGDNEVDDRNFEPFNLNALKDLARLYIGKTIIKDHIRRTDNQVARIFDTELDYSSGKLTKKNEPFATLIAKCYMLILDSNADLRKEIDAGIKKEVSTSMRPKKAICSICGIDVMKKYCPHWNGREYEVGDEKRVCTFTLDGADDAYEASFVVAPAQRRAGVVKSFCKSIEKENSDGNNDTPDEEKQKDIDVAEARYRALMSF